MTAFARVTETHDALSLSLTPCAGQLYRWLLRRKPAGKNQELELEDFATWSGAFRKNPYSIRHIQRALSELIETQLVDVVKRYTSQIFKLVCHHPSDPVQTPPLGFPFDDKNVQIQDGNVHVETEMSKTGHSNPHHSVTTYRECRETTDKKNPPTHPVQKEVDKKRLVSKTPNLSSSDCVPHAMPNTSEKEKLDKTQTLENSPKLSKEIKIDPDLEQQVKEAIAPCPLNAQLKRVVMEAGAELVANALGIVKHTRKKGKVKNPAGLLRRAIEEQWTPNYQPDEPTSPLGFNTWYEAARKAGIVMSSHRRDGQLWIFDANAQPFPYDEMLQRYPLASLQALSTKVSKPRLSQLPVDLSDVLASIDLQFIRLGWAKEKIENFLKQTYGTCRRALLDDDQILDLDSRLKAL